MTDDDPYGPVTPIALAIIAAAFVCALLLGAAP